MEKYLYIKRGSEKIVFKGVRVGEVGSDGLGIRLWIFLDIVLLVWVLFLFFFGR